MLQHGVASARNHTALQWWYSELQQGGGQCGVAHTGCFDIELGQLRQIGGGVRRIVDGKGARGAVILPATQTQQATETQEGVAQALAVLLAVFDHDDGDRCEFLDADSVIRCWAVAVIKRAEAVVAAENAGEGLGITAIAAGEGNIGDAFVGMAEQPGGAVQTHPFQGVVQGLTHHAVIEAVPVPRRHPRCGGDVVQVDVAVVMGLQVVQGAGEMLLVAVMAWCLHAVIIAGGQAG